MAHKHLFLISSVMCLVGADLSLFLEGTRKTFGLASKRRILICGYVEDFDMWICGENF